MHELAQRVVAAGGGSRQQHGVSHAPARGEATSDGVMGWFTVKSRQGEDLVTPGASRHARTVCIAPVDIPNSIPFVCLPIVVHDERSFSFVHIIELCV